MRAVFKRPQLLKTLLNLWPPFLFCGIRIESLSDDYLKCRVGLRLSRWNRNANGTHFGGSLFSMSDPIYALMLMGLLGDRYLICDQSADINFIKPGRGRVYADFELTQQRIDEIREATAAGAKHLPEFVINVIDEQGDLVAKLRRTLYVRHKKSK
ncbi:DUF4442 domain-containing protein [Corallincola luteus]|uniref:DUF4442 domain-containing protein n=2 Tax=Corallincola TaxID=1775176 RepID=A0A368NM65_9GAMM|nr:MULTISPECIES: DUF4442 domain-containing protein [Corallincola]RCU50539.1 DUF4442 domain-containing protein [Corallincola holothuriorum]TCI01863.1 DUF4442 domain-containing protein [Corallincola luteus]